MAARWLGRRVRGERPQDQGGQVDRHPRRPDLWFALAAARTGGSVCVRGLEAEVCERLRGGVVQSDEPRSLRRSCIAFTSSLRAKRSNPARRESLDCFVASLLAMTTRLKRRPLLFGGLFAARLGRSRLLFCGWGGRRRRLPPLDRHERAPLEVINAGARTTVKCQVRGTIAVWFFSDLDGIWRTGAKHHIAFAHS